MLSMSNGATLIYMGEIVFLHQLIPLLLPPTIIITTIIIIINMRAETKVVKTRSGERDGVGPFHYGAAAKVSWQKYWLW